MKCSCLNGLTVLRHPVYFRHFMERIYGFVLKCLCLSFAEWNVDAALEGKRRYSSYVEEQIIIFTTKK